MFGQATKARNERKPGTPAKAVAPRSTRKPLARLRMTGMGARTGRPPERGTRRRGTGGPASTTLSGQNG